MFTTIGTFLSSHEATEILHYAKQIIEVYGYVSLADMLDLCGKNPAYKDSKIGWTEAAFKNAKIKILYEGYAIHMPEFDWHENNDLDTVDEQLQSEPEPINITISASKPELIEQTIIALFKNSKEIKDRPVFINII